MTTKSDEIKFWLTRMWRDFSFRVCNVFVGRSSGDSAHKYFLGFSAEGQYANSWFSPSDMAHIWARRNVSAQCVPKLSFEDLSKTRCERFRRKMSNMQLFFVVENLSLIDIHKLLKL